LSRSTKSDNERVYGGKNMRTWFRLSAILLAALLTMSTGSLCSAEEKETTPGNVSAPTEPAKTPSRVIPDDLTANLNTTFYSKYVWRGLELSKNSLVVFPSLTVGYKGFAANVWVDMDTHFDNAPPGEDKKLKLQETDLTLTYSNKIPQLKLNWTLGWIYYHTDGFNGDTNTSNQEFFGTLAFDLPLKPTLSVYREIETGEAWYTSLGLSHSFALPKKDWSLDVGGWVSYLYNHSTEDFSAFHDGNVWAGLTIPVTSYFSFGPKIQYSFPLSSSAEDRIKANSFNGHDSKWVYGGIIFDLKI
jgi:hypothetical protein